MRTQVQLVGNLGRDPETRQVGDTSVCVMSVAVGRKVKGEDVTDWFRVNAWGKLGETCAQYLSKGSQVVVAGALEPQSYEKDGQTRMSLDVRANEVHFVGGRPAESGPAASSTVAADDDIPF